MGAILRDRSDSWRCEQWVQTIAMVEDKSTQKRCLEQERMSEDKSDTLRQERCLETRAMPSDRAIVGDKRGPECERCLDTKRYLEPRSVRRVESDAWR